MAERTRDSDKGRRPTSKGKKAKTKVVIRKLPNGLTEAKFQEAILSGCTDDVTWSSFVPGFTSTKKSATSRAYINFKTAEAVARFAVKFHGHTFVDGKGNEYTAVVESAPFQRVPRARRRPIKDHREGTIEKDPDYMAFVASLSEETVRLPSAEIQLEEREREKAALAAAGTPMDQFGQIKPSPLVQFVAEKRLAKSSKAAERRGGGKGGLGGGGGMGKITGIAPRLIGGGGGQPGGGGSRITQVRDRDAAGAGLNADSNRMLADAKRAMLAAGNAAGGGKPVGGKAGTKGERAAAKAAARASKSASSSSASSASGGAPAQAPPLAALDAMLGSGGGAAPAKGKVGQKKDRERAPLQQAGGAGGGGGGGGGDVAPGPAGSSAAVSSASGPLRARQAKNAAKEERRQAEERAQHAVSSASSTGPAAASVTSAAGSSVSSVVAGGGGGGAGARPSTVAAGGGAGAAAKGRKGDKKDRAATAAAAAAAAGPGEEKVRQGFEVYRPGAAGSRGAAGGAADGQQQPRERPARKDRGKDKKPGGKGGAVAAAAAPAANPPATSAAANPASTQFGTVKMLAKRPASAQQSSSSPSKPAGGGGEEEEEEEGGAAPVLTPLWRSSLASQRQALALPPTQTTRAGRRCLRRTTPSRRRL